MVLKDRVLANIIVTEPYNEVYDKNFMVSKPTKNSENTHITVKPIALMEHLVKLFSKKGSLVVDPFLGSGTTAIACKNTNRRCLDVKLIQNIKYFIGTINNV